MSYVNEFCRSVIHKLRKIFLNKREIPFSIKELAYHFKLGIIFFRTNQIIFYDEKKKIFLRFNFERLP